jgi:hypothetical protein
MCGWIVTTGGVKLDVAIMAVVGVIMIRPLCPVQGQRHGARCN